MPHQEGDTGTRCKDFEGHWGCSGVCRPAQSWTGNFEESCTPADQSLFVRWGVKIAKVPLGEEDKQVEPDTKTDFDELKKSRCIWISQHAGENRRLNK